MNNFYYRINHVKKNSCILLNKIPMNNTLKDTFLEKSYNNIYNKNTENNLTSRLNTSINSKNSIKIKKMTFFSRPYIKQLSQYCFLTFKNKTNHKISEINDDKKNDKMIIPEKDDKTNIYFNLIKTYYDENGTKLKPKKAKVYPIVNENDYPKIIKTKKKKKNNSLDEKENENFLNFEKKNKTMNNNCNIYFANLENNDNTRNYTNDKLITQKKIIKREKYNFNSINRKNKTPSNISSGKLTYRNTPKNPVISPTTSEKSFNIFFQNKSDYIINDIQNNPIITGSVGNLNNDSNIIINRNNNNYDLVYLNEREKDNYNTINDIMMYFNKKVFNHRRMPTTNKINEIKLTHEFKSYDSFNNKTNYRYNNNQIFQKKKISDSFDEIRRVKIKKHLVNNKSKLITNFADTFIIQNNNPQKYFFNSGRNLRHNSTTLSWTKANLNTNNNIKINRHYNETKISPKRLEKYFNPNQFNKNTFSFKAQCTKSPPNIQIIDINNITFKKPFKLVKNIKSDNNLTSDMNKINMNNIKLKNDKRIITSYYDNNHNNNYKNKQILSQNISYNYDKPKEISSIISDKSKKNCRNDNNSNSDMMHSYNIKYMKNKFKQNPYSFSNEKMKILHNNYSNNEKRKSKNQFNENINFNNEIKPYNNIINNINITDIDNKKQKEKIKKYLVQRNCHRNSKIKIHFSNNKIKEKEHNDNKYIEGVLNNANKQNNISYQISITEPSIIYNQIKIKNSIRPKMENKNNNQKIIIEKDKRGNKKMYILRKKLKEGIIKLKTKFDVQNKLGIKKDI